MQQAKCHYTGISFKFESPPMGEAIHSATHPLAYMPLESAKAILLRLSQVNNVHLTPEQLYNYLVQLRLASFRILVHVNALTEHYEASHISSAYVNNPNTDHIDATNEVHIIKVEALSTLVLLDRYNSTGMPKLAILELGSIERLLRTCVKVLSDELFAENMLNKLGFGTAVDYQVRIAAQVQPAIFVSSCLKLLPAEEGIELATMLYHFYLISKLSNHIAGLTSEESETLVACASTTLQHYNSVSEIPRLVRASTMDILVAEALTCGATAYMRHFVSQYERLKADFEKPKLVTVIRGLPPSSMQRRNNQC